MLSGLYQRALVVRFWLGYLLSVSTAHVHLLVFGVWAVRGGAKGAIERMYVRAPVLRVRAYAYAYTCAYVRPKSPMRGYVKIAYEA